MRKYYLKKEDFKYFEYNLSDCKISSTSVDYEIKIREN